MPNTKIDFLYLSEPDMIAAGVKNMPLCVDTMEKVIQLLNAGDYMMSGNNHNSHGAMVTFPDEPAFPICRRMVVTGDSWQCLLIWAANLIWQA